MQKLIVFVIDGCFDLFTTNSNRKKLQKVFDLVLTKASKYGISINMTELEIEF